MISKDEVVKIAKLARLDLTEQEIKKIQKDLSSVLDYFNVLKNRELETGVEKEKLEIKNILRKDEASERNPVLADNLIKMAPDKKDGYIKVKAIL
jgi:aspartyl-tRNA(Asn)/glutamyl-tRNA(Gln) amidotransferase subunit C